MFRVEGVGSCSVWVYGLGFKLEALRLRVGLGFSEYTAIYVWMSDWVGEGTRSAGKCRVFRRLQNQNSEWT